MQAPKRGKKEGSLSLSAFENEQQVRKVKRRTHSHRLSTFASASLPLARAYLSFASATVK